MKTTTSTTPPVHFSEGLADRVGEGVQLKAPSQQVICCEFTSNADMNQQLGDNNVDPEVHGGAKPPEGPHHDAVHLATKTTSVHSPVGTADRVWEGAELKAPSQQVMHQIEISKSDYIAQHLVDPSCDPEVVSWWPSLKCDTSRDGPQLITKDGTLCFTMGAAVGQSQDEIDTELECTSEKGCLDNLKEGMESSKGALEQMKEEWAWYRELGKLYTIGTWRLNTFGSPISLKRELSKLPTINEKRAWKPLKRKPKGGPSLHLGNITKSYSDGARFIYGIGKDRAKVDPLST